MRIGAIGIGEAGGRITDKLVVQVKKDKRIKTNVLPFSFAVNTARSDLLGLRKLPKKRRLLVGRATARGHGVGLKRRLAKKIVTDELGVIKREIGTLETYDLDAFFIIAGLGGGTGSGGSPIVAQELRDVYKLPVFTIGVLPTDGEGDLMARNAILSIKELREVSDGLILFDNNLWRTEGIPISQTYDMMNYELTKPLPFLMQAGEAVGKKVGIKVVDASDIIMTLKGDSVMGWSEINVPRRFSIRRRTSIERIEQATRCEMAIANASTRLSALCDLQSVGGVLSLLVGPPGELSTEGVERGKTWVKSVMSNAETRGGDFPITRRKRHYLIPRRRKLTGILLFSRVKNIPRLRELERVVRRRKKKR